MTPRTMTIAMWLCMTAPAGCRAEQPEPAAKASPARADVPSSPGSAVPPDPDANLLAAGAPAPDVSGTAHDGTEVSLAKLRGKPVVVYFYPKDDTPGCTVQAQDFRDDGAELAALGAVVIGVSMDDLASHKAFAEKFQLNFPLLADQDGAIAAKFGVSTTRGVAKRTTFVIAPDGKIARVFANVKPEGHSDEVLAAVRAAAGS